jgi:toxin ParE1/3/4
MNATGQRRSQSQIASRTLASLLGEFPFIGHLTDEADVRSLPVVRYPFVIFYAIDDAASEVVILHVRHAAREPPQISR